MSNDDEADRIGVDQSDIKDEGYEVVVEYYWLEVEIERNKGPSDKVWEETEKRRVDIFALLTPDFNNVQRTMVDT